MKKFFLSFAFAIVFSSLSLAEDDYPYRAISVSFGDSWNIVRFQPKTGRAWFVSNDAFVEIIDNEPIPIGHYDFSTSSTHDIRISTNPISSHWQLIRINTETGETWWANDAIWVKVDDTKTGNEK